MTDTKTIEITIPAFRTGVLFRNLKRLNKKAAVQRAGEFSVKLGDERISKQPVDRAGEITYVPVRVIDVEITGPSFSIEGFEFVCLAKLEDPNQYFDFNADGFDGYDEITSACDHCKTSRYRKNIFVLRNLETGETKQVGKSCAKDFFGYSPADALKGAGFWNDVRNWEDNDRQWIRETPSNSLRHVVAIAIDVIGEHGYVSRANSEDEYGEPIRQATSDRVNASIYSPNKANPLRGPFTNEQYAEADVVIDWARGEFVDQGNDGTDGGPDTRSSDSFVLNVAGILDAENVPQNMTGFAACLPALKKRGEDRKAADAASANSEHFGEIKKRAEYEFEVISENFFDNDFGGTTLYTMLISGNVAKWWSSTHNLEVGQKGTAKMTVKDHDEYHGVKQTIVNRVAVAA